MTAAEYVRANFDPADRIAVVCISRSEEHTVQRIMDASAAMKDGPQPNGEKTVQGWLRHMNSPPDPGKEKNGRPFDIYISMNVLKPDARGRTKADIKDVRHVYLDIDERGKEVVDRVMDRADVPKPSFLLESSPGRYQLTWKVEGFTIPEAETLTRGMARELGADAAVWDASRVLRLPGFANNKYPERPYVKVTAGKEGIVGPGSFPDAFLKGDEDYTMPVDRAGLFRQREPNEFDQSRKDFAYACNYLREGRSPEDIAREIDRYRAGDGKGRDYGRRTVAAAAKRLERDEWQHDRSHQRER